MIIIEAENLYKVYKLYRKTTDRIKEAINPFNKKYHRDFYALKNVTFNAKKGDIVGVIGKNGSGKSTLLKIIAGVLTPTSGNVHIKGRISALLELGAGFNPDLTGLENIYFHGTIMGYNKEEIDRKLDSILTFADIGEFINQPVKIYSSGMFVRLAFATAINVDPEILIIDEALAVGDIAFQLKCYKKFSEFQESGKTIILVTHSMESILKYCTKVIVMHEGICIKEGTPKEMVDVYKKLQVNHSGSSMISELNEIKDQEWKKCFDINNGYLEYGNTLAEIIDFGIFDGNNSPTTNFLNNEIITFKMKVKFKQKIEDPIFAFTIKDLKGNELAGTNTINENVNTLIYHEKDEVIVTFSQLLKLRTGHYTLSFGCTKFIQDELVIYHRLYDVLIFQVNAIKSFTGIFDIDSEIEIAPNYN